MRFKSARHNIELALVVSQLRNEVKPRDEIVDSIETPDQAIQLSRTDERMPTQNQTPEKDVDSGQEDSLTVTEQHSKLEFSEESEIESELPHNSEPQE